MATDGASLASSPEGSLYVVYTAKLDRWIATPNGDEFVNYGRFAYATLGPGGWLLHPTGATSAAGFSWAIRAGRVHVLFGGAAGDERYGIFDDR